MTWLSRLVADPLSVFGVASALAAFLGGMAVSGRFSVRAANVCFVVSWLLILAALRHEAWPVILPVGVVTGLGLYLVGRWVRPRPAPAVPLQITAEILDGGMERSGMTQVGEERATLWDLWLELSLVPVKGSPATIPLHRLTGSLTIGSLQADGLDMWTVETVYTLPPPLVHLLSTSTKRPRDLTISTPLPVLVAASCHTLGWSTGHPAAGEATLCLTLAIAEGAYLPLTLRARFTPQDATTWRLSS